MSGFLPDLASWALRGGANNNDDADNNNNTNDNNEGPPVPTAALTEDEVRARRLRRMEAMMARQEEQATANEPQPMDVEEPASVKKDPPSAAAARMETTTTSSPPRKKAAPESVTATTPYNSQQQKKKAKETHASPADVDRKLQRKKELLLKKVLQVSLVGTLTANDKSVALVLIDLDGSTQIGVSTIAELLATRLSLSPDSKLLQTIPSQKPLLQYLAQAHRLAGEENKNLQQQSNNSKKDTSTTTELQAMLQEIQNQVVSYAASTLMEPDLFELAKDGTTQLARCLFNNAEPASSITFGVAGASTSFWYCLCEELITQDSVAFGKVIAEIVAFFMARIAKCESVDGGIGESNPLGIVSALGSMCAHKKAAMSMTEVQSFLLPALDAPEANELTRPPLQPAGADLLRMLSGENRPYKKRSGPALEKDTLLGVCLRVATPKNNPAFSPASILRQSLDSVERTTSSQRQQLRAYQEACNHLVMGLVKAGPDARGRVRI
jgi:hypothetical protein